MRNNVFGCIGGQKVTVEYAADAVHGEACLTRNKTRR